MDVNPEDLQFLRDLVKSSRQRVHHLTWTDRDGTKRVTALTDAEFAKVKSLAGALNVSPAEALRQAAHVPNAR